MLILPRSKILEAIESYNLVEILMILLFDLNHKSVDKEP